MTARAALDAAARGDHAIRSLYIHVPFCFHKCHYCDFYSFVDSQDRQGPFVEALSIELGALASVAHRGGRRPTLDTLFIGGGTPTLLRLDAWDRLLASLHERFDLAEGAEFTVECNPETATADLLARLRAGGVTRLSIGAQSFNPTHLRTLERWHDPASVARALALAADAGIERRSLDLIFAIPGQTLDEWRWELDTALAIAPGVDHLSCYALTYEPNTAMTHRLKRGEFAPADEPLEEAMFRLTVSRLRDHGFERYEVSNFARPGRAGGPCRHNLAYWRQEEWLAAGPSASAHAAGFRWKNVPRLTEWMEGVRTTRGEAPVIDLETPDPRRALAERIMTGLRIAEGLDAARIMHDADALDCRDPLARAVARHASAGWIDDAEGRLRLTDEGMLRADGVAADLMSRLR